MRWWTHGTIESSQRPLAERYWSKVKIGPVDECWRWLASTFRDGRPQFGMGSRTDRSITMVAAFRVGYELTYGPIPAGMDGDHLCNHSWCVNPHHVKITTPKENRGRPQRERTRCPQGHAYDAVNTYVRKDGSRQCRACAADYQRSLRAQRRLAISP